MKAWASSEVGCDLHRLEREKRLRLEFERDREDGNRYTPGRHSWQLGPEREPLHLVPLGRGFGSRDGVPSRPSPPGRAPHRTAAACDRHGGRIVNIKAGRVGGFTPARAVHDLCQHHGVPVWCGGMLESGIGRAYNVALASLFNFTIPGDVSPSARYWERDIVIPEWAMDADGMVTVPAKEPGLGVQVDLDLVDDLTERSKTVRRV